MNAQQALSLLAIEDTELQSVIKRLVSIGVSADVAQEVIFEVRRIVALKRDQIYINLMREFLI